MASARVVFAWFLFGVTAVTSAVYLESEEELNETVICTNDHMEVVIPSVFFLNKVPPVYVGDLHLNDPECRGVEVDDSFVFSIKTNLSDCGTTVVSDDTHIMFRNTIHNNYSDIITRNYINITFVCRYPISYMVQQPNGENMIRVDIRSITLNTEDGNFSVSMLLYKDEAFKDRWTTVPSLTLDDDIFVKVFMTPAQLRLRLERCWATPTREPYGNIQYTFIRDRSAAGLFMVAAERDPHHILRVLHITDFNETYHWVDIITFGVTPTQDGLLTNEQTLGMLKNGEGPEAMFRLQMFKFVGSSYTNVFLHCNVQICHSGQSLCQPNCSAEDGLMRIRRDIPLSHTVSYGPIRRLLTVSEKPNLNSSGVPPVETFVLGGLLIVLLLITAVFGRLWLRSRHFYPAREAQLTLSNIHHISDVAS